VKGKTEMRRIRHLLIGLTLATLGAGSAAMASPVAMATNMTGKPQYRASGASWKPLGVLTRLSPGDSVKCGPGQEAVVMMFVNGVRFRVASNSTGTVGPNSVRGAELMAGAGGATIRVAKAMTGLDTDPFLARAGLSHQRLDKSSPGIMTAGTTTFTWPALEDAASYTFTLFDQHDNVVWSVRTNQTSADYPSDLTPLVSKRPYVWKLSGFGESGKPVVSAPWGIITFLTTDDQNQLAADINALNAQLAADPSDLTPLTLEVERYAQDGVFEGAISTLEDVRLNGQPGIQDSLADHYAMVSHMAVMLAANAAKKDSADSGDQY